MLSFSVDNLTALERVHGGNDDDAAAIIASAKQNVVALRNRYAGDAPMPLDPSAAQELRELTGSLKKTGRDSRNDRALRDLEHEATRIDVFVNSIGIMYGQGGVRFEKQAELPRNSFHS